MWLKLTTVVTSTIKFLERAVYFLFYITVYTEWETHLSGECGTWECKD